ncbi:hypothetical protein CRV24_007539 [Beauveria bassiana]|nr:hypothetical protein CRV24_007539 [Beauveria bassiana]KAH8715571.1 hypothetical protein HC256_004380 [Beauveria bassiana]
MSIFLNQFHEQLVDDILTHDDWQVLKTTHKFLQPFYQATMEQQMEWASIDQMLKNMDILLKQFEDAKIRDVDNGYMVNPIHMGWWVLAKFHEESDANPNLRHVAAAPSGKEEIHRPALAGGVARRGNSWRTATVGKI